MASPADQTSAAAPEPGPLAVQDVLARAATAGLPLTAAEAAGLLPSVRRLDAMAHEVRAIVGPGVEPSGPAVGPWRTPR